LPVRARWIDERGDTEELAGPTSHFVGTAQRTALAEMRLI
jgi:hypothetical protein